MCTIIFKSQKQAGYTNCRIGCATMVFIESCILLSLPPSHSQWRHIFLTSRWMWNLFLKMAANPPDFHIIGTSWRQTWRLTSMFPTNGGNTIDCQSKNNHNQTTVCERWLASFSSRQSVRLGWQLRRTLYKNTLALYETMYYVQVAQESRTRPKTHALPTLS